MFYASKKFPIIMLIFLTLQTTDLCSQGFDSVMSLSPLASTKNTGEKPQSKVWKYDGKWWSVFPDTTGTYIWRLDGNSWSNTLKISSNTVVKADCKVVGDVCHILLWKKAGFASQFVSVEYVPASRNYKRWSQRTSTTSIQLDSGVEVGTIDIDTTGRLWLASDGVSDIVVRWSDPPYTTFSPPFVIASGVRDDDIAAVISLPTQGQIGVLWSNQNTKRFGFKIHGNGSDPSAWSADEVPASQSALDVGKGMSDDHLNMKVASDGTLYCAVKTGYDRQGYPLVSLLKRHPNGVWDNLYEVSQTGTRPIVILNEVANTLKVVYSASEGGSDILYRESALTAISFGPVHSILQGAYDNATSAKGNYDSDIVILASDNIRIDGIRGIDSPDVTVPPPPQLVAPPSQSVGQPIDPVLRWDSSAHATSYRVLLSDHEDFSTLFVDQGGVSGNSLQVDSLFINTRYYWKVQASNSGGSSDWSETWSFTTTAGPSVPVLTSPANFSVDIPLDPTFIWEPSSGADIYELQIALTDDFANPVVSQINIADTTWQTEITLNNNTKYYWRVRSVSNDLYSDWSAPWSFTTIAPLPEIPVLISPPNGAVNTGNRLVWKSADHASTYNLQVSSSPAFSSPIIHQTGITDTVFTTTDLIHDATYYWKVSGENGVGTGSWSVTWSFIARSTNYGDRVVGHWRLDEGSGTAIHDASGLENNGQSTGSPQWTNGISGSALRLNGSGQYVGVPDSPSLNISGGITLAAWVRPEKDLLHILLGKPTQNIISKGSYSLSLTPKGKVSMSITQNTGTASRVESRKYYPVNGTWMHIAGTFNGTVLKIYINGVEDKQSTLSWPTSIQVNDLPLLFGAAAGGTKFYLGTFDDLRVYNYALSGAEIYDLLNASSAKTDQSASMTQNERLKIKDQECHGDPQEEIQVFPNPAGNTLFIHLPQGTEHLISITDVNGWVLYRATTAEDNDKITIQLDAFDMSGGLYFLNIQSPGSQTVKKIFKK